MAGPEFLFEYCSSQEAYNNTHYVYYLSSLLIYMLGSWHTGGIQSMEPMSEPQAKQGKAMSLSELNKYFSMFINKKAK